MMKTLWPVAGTRGLVIDVAIIDGDKQAVDLTTCTAARLDVTRYRSSDPPVTWEATPEAGGILRHVVPADTPLTAGTYILQPHLEFSNGFRGSWGAVVLIVLEQGELRQ